MGQQEVEESAEKMVEEVESTLKRRKERAIEKARESAEQTEQPDSFPRFTTPPVSGGGIDKRHFSSRVEFTLVDEMHTGQSSFYCHLPTENQVTDETHPLNRILSLYNIEPDRIADINGEKLPVVPHGDYKNADSITYELDIPPVPTAPNMFMYRIRRLALKMKLIRIGVTPQTETNVHGHVTGISYVDEQDTGVKHMPKEAIDIYRILGWESDTKRFVPTTRGMIVWYVLQAPILLFPLLLAALGYLRAVMLFPVFLLILAMLNREGLNMVGEKFSKHIKNKYFSSA